MRLGYGSCASRWVELGIDIDGLCLQPYHHSHRHPFGELPANHDPYCENQVHIVLDLPLRSTHYAALRSHGLVGCRTYVNVPIPPSVLLMGSGLLGLGLVGWRRRQKKA